MTDSMPISVEDSRKLSGALACPPQRAHWVATRAGIDQGSELFDQSGITIAQLYPAATLAAGTLRGNSSLFSSAKPRCRVADSFR